VKYFFRRLDLAGVRRRLDTVRVFSFFRDAPVFFRFMTFGGGKPFSERRLFDETRFSAYAAKIAKCREKDGNVVCGFACCKLFEFAMGDQPLWAGERGTGGP